MNAPPTSPRLYALVPSAGVVGVRCDRSRIQQLAANLLSNAVTYGAPDAPVSLSAEAVGNELRLTVSNEGEPISAENQANIFKPFWRRGKSGNRGGLGLGLFIWSEIVRAHGGSLEVISSPETGTTFGARLPAIPAQNAFSPTDIPSPKASPARL